MQILILTIVAFLVAIFGSLIGVGGGFLLMPVLLLLFPEHSQANLTFISLVAVLVNALSATRNYARMRRIDYRTAILFGLSTVPTAVLARLAVDMVDRSQFARIFGAMLVGLACLILWQMFRRRQETKPATIPDRWTRRRIVDSDGFVYEYAFNPRIGIGIASLEGFLAAFFGIGGGVMIVPMLNQLLGVPMRVAASTSICILAVSATAALLTDGIHHAAQGTLRDLPWALSAVAAVGAFFGAQVGTRLSRRVSARKLMTLLAVALMLVGIKMALTKPAPTAAPPPPEKTQHP